MTETPYTPPPESLPPPEPSAPPSGAIPGSPPRPPLRRSRSDRVVAGVAGGFGRYLGIDPVLVRVILVVLTIFGGSGILLYLAGWLLIPEEGREESAGQQLVSDRDTLTTVLIVAVVILAASVALPFGSLLWFGFGPDFGAPLVLLTVGAIALVVWLVRRDRAPTTLPGAPAATGTAPSPSTPSSTPSGTAMSYAPGSTTEHPTVPVPQPVYAPPAPKPPRPRSVLGLLTVSVAALVVGTLVALNVAVGADISGVVILGTALAVVGLGLLVGTLLGRSRGLIALGIVLALLTAAAAATPRIGLDGGVGDRTWTPTVATTQTQEYRLGMGEATLDLTDVTLNSATQTASFDASVGIGQLTVLVPSDVDVAIEATVGLGEIVIPGQQLSGNDRSVSTLIDVPNETGQVELQLDVGLGQIQVTSVRTGALGLSSLEVTE